MDFQKLKRFISSYKNIILTLICFIAISLIAIVIYIKNPNKNTTEQTNSSIPLLKKSDNNFIYSVPNGIGQLFPNKELGLYALYADSQEFLVQKPLISTFFEELVDEEAWNQLSSNDKSDMLHYNSHLIPRKFVFHLIESIKNSKDFNQYIGTNDGFKQSQNQTSKNFTFVLRPDAKFENGTPINAKTIQTTINKFISLFGDFKDMLGLKNIGTEKDSNYVKTFEDKPYEFQLKFSAPKSLFEVIKNINRIILIEETQYNASISPDGQIKYGTAAYPFISYGPYIINQGYNDKTWIFSKNNSYFDHHKNVLPYDEVQMLIEHNSGSSVQETELFQDNKLHLYVCDANKIDSKFLDNFKKDLFCKPAGYSLIMSFSSNPRVKDPNLRKALFYSIDRNKIKSISSFLSPSLDLMSDVYRTKDSIFTFNDTQEHEQNITDMFKQDLKEYCKKQGTYPNHSKGQKDAALQSLKNNFGYDSKLSQFFLSKYKKNQQQIELTLATRDGVFTDENFIREIKEQIETAFTIDGIKQINLLYRLNDSTADINISVSGLKPECLISTSEYNIRRGNNNSFYLPEEESTQTALLKLEKKVYSELLFNMPLAQMKQMRFLFDVEHNFIKYFKFFGFKTKPYDFVGEFM
ncbi:ABC-type oligopeptide transport system, periplasmatic component [Candidatus Phytoplasma mali]|uniref:ABC-type oligopeptide transport system, periplasmatic component n=1 Tax=Phytoplasma mali (strain AT) TaxID=482235 RepID=B3R0R6_PHYMT|nr:ABC transporter substrate-binding protein [Candidatus Phytoplasma mali]CAP18650.1 ABC-type oligopeptide transport system, periplasmatic component [Candidatus Phytoplasma mali]